VGLQQGLFAAGIFALIEQWFTFDLWAPVLQPVFSFALAATLLSGAGLLASFLHLGRPVQAWQALRNWRSSPLSREVWLASLFFGLQVISLGVGLFGPGRFSPASTVLWTGLVGAAGLAALVSMAQIYRLRTIPAWEQRRPLTVFLQTALALGGLGAALLLALFQLALAGPPGWTVSAERSLLQLGAVGVGWILAWEWGQRSKLFAGGGLHHLPEARAAVMRLERRAAGWHAAGFAAALLALAAPGYALVLLAAAWALAFAGELQRRTAFYLARRE
jgi:DMSO reductase anchor subunit